MRFIVDECTGPTVAKWLQSEGHETFSVFEKAQGIDDEKILIKAVAESWIVITNDKDFGEMIFSRTPTASRRCFSPPVRRAHCKQNRGS